MSCFAVERVKVDVLQREDELKKERGQREKSLDGEEHSHKKSTHVVWTLSTCELKTCTIVRKKKTNIVHTIIR